MDKDFTTVLFSTAAHRGGGAGCAKAWVALLALTALAAGCQQARPPAARPVLPPVLASTTDYPGTPLSGPRAEPVPASLAPGDAWAVEVTLVSLGRMPTGGKPLGGQTVLVTATHGASVVLPSARLTRGARVATLPNPSAFAAVFGGSGQPVTLLSARGAVPVGATAAFKVSENMPREDRAAGQIWRRGVEVDVFRPAPAGAIKVALAVEDYAQPGRTDSSAETPAPAAAPSRQHEVAVVDLPSTPGAQTIAFAVAFRFQGWNGQAVGAVLTVSPGSSDPAQVKAVAACLKEMRVWSQREAAAPDARYHAGEEGSALRVAIEALADPQRRRSAFIYLAGQTGAGLCGAAALVADDATLAHVAGDVAKRASADLTDPAAIGWLLDRTWLLDMGDLLGNAKLSPELSAVLTTHAGEVGRNPSSIEEVGNAAHSVADYQSLLVAENVIFLEDSSPAARARAFDWLVEQHKAPAGYKPIGQSPKQRREALERAALGLPPATAPSTAPSTEPDAGAAEATTGPSTELATSQRAGSRDAPNGKPPLATAPTTGVATEPLATTVPTTRAVVRPAVTTVPATRATVVPGAPTTVLAAKTLPTTRPAARHAPMRRSSAGPSRQSPRPGEPLH